MTVKDEMRRLWSHGSLSLVALVPTGVGMVLTTKKMLLKTQLKKLFEVFGLLKPYRSIRKTLSFRSANAKYLNFYEDFVRKGDLCFDIGGNVGVRTEIFLWLGAAKVVTAEPHAGCMKELRARFGRNPRVILVNKALGAKEGFAEMRTTTELTQISSLSKQWVDVFHANDPEYTRTVQIPVTTLDTLIQQHGRPAFCKIDVEGFEEEVLKGLTQPIGAVSFEFHAHPDVIASTVNCINRLASLGNAQFNYSFGDSMTLNLPEWVGHEEICTILLSIADEIDYAKYSGDVYGKFVVPATR